MEIFVLMRMLISSLVRVDEAAGRTAVANHLWAELQWRNVISCFSDHTVS